MIINKEPGPGSYNIARDHVIDLNDLDTDALITLNELKNNINSKSSMLETAYLEKNVDQLSKL